MIKNFFLIGTLSGLLMVYLIGYLILSKNFLDYFDFNGVLTMTAGSGVTILAAIYFDKKKINKNYFISALILPPFIFLLGTTFGCLLNFILNGKFQDFYSWFVKPFYWMSIVGIPLSMILGTISYLIFKYFFKTL